ncbi:MAG: hypothetical protein HYX85_02765 [Chloroflexi bacterium]|nr:hypothetical protein [Chloroflexota bacterium]
MKGLKVFLFLSFLYFAIYGVMALIVPSTITEMVGSDEAHARILAAVGIGFATAILYAFLDPVKNVAITRAVIVLLGLEALLLIFSSATNAIPWSETMVGIILDAALAIGLVIFLPAVKKAAA